MSKKFILHMITPEGNLSPFDVNMAIDAGYEAVIPYTGVQIEDVSALVQDAIFSRGTEGVKRTGIFIGGRSIDTAMEMLQITKDSMVPPFEVSAFADPSGAYTTSAAMVACSQNYLQSKYSSDLKEKRIIALGGTGPVGIIAAILGAQNKAKVTIVSSSSLERSQSAAKKYGEKYAIPIDASDIVEDSKGSSKEKLQKLLSDTNIIFAVAKAGIQVVAKQDLEKAEELLIAADVNAVPPSGIEGLDVSDDGKILEHSKTNALGIGALAIGNVKYQTQRNLLQKMIGSDKPIYLDFIDAFEEATKHTKK